MTKEIVKWPETVAVVCPSHEAAVLLGSKIQFYLEDVILTAVVGEMLIMETSPDQAVREAIQVTVSELKRDGLWPWR